MARTGDINAQWDDSTGAAQSAQYPNQNLDVQRPIDIIILHGGANRPQKGKIWKMLRSIPGGGELNHWETFSANGITGNADVDLKQVP